MENEELLHEVMTAAEVADEFGVEKSTVRRWCLGQNGRPPLMPPGTFRRGKPTWLLLRKYAKALAERDKKNFKKSP